MVNHNAYCVLIFSISRKMVFTTKLSMYSEYKSITTALLNSFIREKWGSLLQNTQPHFTVQSSLGSSRKKTSQISKVLAGQVMADLRMMNTYPGQQNFNPNQQPLQQPGMMMQAPLQNQGFPQQTPYPQGFPQQPNMNGMMTMSGSPGVPFVTTQQPGFPAVIPTVVQHVTSFSPNVPRGLPYLATLDRLFVRQQIELMEVKYGFETNNRYKIYDSLGNEVFYAKEDTDCCTRNCCGAKRPFDMSIQDSGSLEVMHLTRALRASSCCFPCCLQSLKVFAPPGTFVGSIEQEWSLCKPHFCIKDERGQAVLYIVGPCTTMACCNDAEFDIVALNRNTKVGKISKQWSGLAQEAFTDADNFGISFPLDLHVNIKAVMIGAIMLIDFMYFENSSSGDTKN